MPTIRALEGFFTRTEESPCVATSKPPLFSKFAHVAGSNWAELERRVADAAAQGRNIKVVYFVRHGEGTHNVAQREYGRQRWKEEFAMKDEFLDANLTVFGMRYARCVGPPALERERVKGMPTIQRVVVSTLSRTIQTAEIFFAEYPLPSPTFVSMELCREILGVETCDKRVSLTKLKNKFPRVDFTKVQDEEDELWTPTHRETDAEIKIRARAFLLQFFHEIPDRYVAVVAHSKFIRMLYDMLRPGETDLAPANCEVIPLVLEQIA